MNEENTAVSRPERPRIIEYHKKPDRTPMWVLFGVIVGFMLPLCSCGIFMFTAVASAGMIGSSSPTSFGGTGDAVAIVRVEGTILSSDQISTADAVSARVIDDLEAAAADDAVKAIVLRVNSPGGSVTGSAQIWEAIQALEKPIVASMAGTAASGGYYVSAPTDYIFARPDTLTGSLGVVLTLYDATDLIEEIGVRVIDITSGENKAMGSPWAELTPDQQAILESITQEAYDDFVYVIAEGRGMSDETVRQLADGRVYSGQQALDNGLVDELGDLAAAIRKAAELGGISGEPRIIEYDHPPTLEDFLAGLTTRLNRTEAQQAMELINTFTTPALEYRYAGPGGAN
jgi:protease IV